MNNDEFDYNIEYFNLRENVRNIQIKINSFLNRIK